MSTREQVETRVREHDAKVLAALPEEYREAERKARESAFEQTVYAILQREADATPLPTARRRMLRPTDVVGATVRMAHNREGYDAEQSAMLVFEMPDGSIISAEIWSDEEGNGAGHLAMHVVEGHKWDMARGLVKTRARKAKA